MAKWLDAKEARARSAGLEAKRKRDEVRAAELARAAKVKIALARRAKGKAGAKAAEDEIAAASSTPAEVVEFEDSLIESQPLGLARAELEQVLDEIEDMVKRRETGGFTGKRKGPEDVERVKEIDKRQKLCMNPEKVPGSKLFNKRQAEVEGEQGERKRRKADGVDSDDEEVPVAKHFSVKPEPQV